jgi:hypothetical protein
MAWQDVAKEKFGSGRSIGRLLHKKLRPKDRARWGEVALGNKVSELIRGEVDWWLGTGAEVLPLLAELLSVEVDELVGAPVPTEGVIEFPEFPALPPLRPDEPFAAGPADSLLALALEFRNDEARLRSHRWIEAPPGAGKSFTIRYVATRAPSAFVAATVQTLEEALALVKDRSTQLLVEVERPSPTDRDALHALGRATRGCAVLAPFGVPEDVLGNPTTGYVTSSGWKKLTAPAFARWRDELAGWVMSRIESVPGRETHLDVDALRTWLARHDPECALISSPADLLALCADFDVHGERESSLRVRARRWLRDVGLSRAKTWTTIPWSGRSAVSLYAEVVGRRLTHLETDFGHTDRTDWERLLSGATAPSGATIDPRAAVDELFDAGLLRPAGRGVVPSPRWVAAGLEDEQLEALFDDDDTSGWGLVAADEARGGVIDRALDRLASGAFRRLVKKVVAAFDVRSLGRRAALEAVFASAARRAEAGTEAPSDDHQLWHELVRVQFVNLEGTGQPGDRPTPYTRRDPEELFANGWALSLALPPPSAPPPSTWYLPAWSSELSLVSMPPAFPPAVGEGEREPARRVCVQAIELVRQLEVQDVPEQVPLVLLPALLLDVGRPWALHPHHLVRLHSELFEEDVLIGGADALAAPSRAELASRIWTLLATKACVVERLQILENGHPRLAPLVLAHLSPAAVEETVREHGLHIGPDGAERDPLVLRALSRPLRDAALRAWSRRPANRRPKWIEASVLVPILDSEDIDLVLDLVGEADNETGAQLAKAVWRDDAGRALDAAVTSVAANSENAGRWFWTAPRSALPALAAALERARARPSWGAAWANRRALEGGPAAERLYSYARA